MISRRILMIAVLVPILGVVVMVGRAEFGRQAGTTWRIPITAYDPRDLLRGHYLRYQYVFDWQGEDSCGQGSAERPAAGCCLCLAASGGLDRPPRVRQIQCDETEPSCDCVLQGSAVQAPQRYFIPEARARELEARLSGSDAALELQCTADGQVAIRELFIDGRPWRDAVSQ